MPDPAPSGYTRTGAGGAAEEQHLITAARGGDRNAFRCLVERHMKDAYNIAYSFTGDHHAAEEVAQEAFVRVFRSLHSFRGDSSFGTWLYRIVTNLSLNRVKAVARRRLHEVLTVEEEPVVAAEPGPDFHAGETRALIERALHELPTMQRAVVILRHIDGLTTKQVSNILGCTEGTVKTHLFRGLEKLRQKLEDVNNER